MKDVIIFDFDKTLTNYDTTFSFFLFCCKYHKIKYLLIPFFIFIKLSSKFKIISVKKEKEIGLILFCPNDVSEFRKRCSQFATTIKLNEIYHSCFIKLKNKNIIIASASFQLYLECLFPENIVIGTTVELDKDMKKIIGIDNHPFGKEKAEILLTKGISMINSFYTDSKTDIPTSQLSEKTYWVKRGKIIRN